MSTALWSIDELVSATGAQRDREASGTVSGVSIDSRSLAKGDLFVPLVAERDGHAFVSSAFAAGAACALVRADYQRKPGDGVLLRVADTLDGLRGIGIAARARCEEARVVAVTGSVGKTGTKEMLRACLEAVAPGRAHGAIKSFNNHWGVPLTLARMPAGTTHAVFEIGMNHAGEITPLTRMVRPGVAIITTVEPVHIEFFDSLDGIAEAKAEILLGVPKGGVAVLNADNQYIGFLSARASDLGLRVTRFGRSAAADVRLLDANADPEGTTVRVAHGTREIAYRIGAPGAHYVQNSLAVVGALDALGIDPAIAAEVLPSIQAPQGRGARETLALDSGGAILLVDESYNANPASMRAALAVLGSIPRQAHPRRIAVLGDMRELGTNADQFHAALWPAVDSSGADLVFACGPHMRRLVDQVPPGRLGGWAASSVEIAPWVAAVLAAGDAVMIKGSLGTNMAPIVAAVRARASRGGA